MEKRYMAPVLHARSYSQFMEDCFSLFLMLGESNTPCEDTRNRQSYSNVNMHKNLTSRFLSDYIIVIYLRNEKYETFILKEAINF